jgi:hypothetical protein
MRRKFLFLWAVLAGIAMGGLPSPASASFGLEYSINGGAFSTVGVVLTGTGTPGDPFAAMVDIGSLTIHASASGSTSTGFTSMDLGVTGIEAAATKIQVVAGFTGILTAPPPQELHWGMSNTTVSGSGVPGVSMEQWVVQSSTLFAMSPAVMHVGPMSLPPLTLLSGMQTGALTVPYGMTLETTLDNSGSASSTASLSTDNSAQLIPGPAPGGLVLLASAVPALIGTWLRRRKTALN